MRESVEQIPQLPVPVQKTWPEYLLDSLLAVGGALALTGIIYMYHLYPTIPNISIVYLLLILLLASTRSRYAAILASVVSFFSFDFFLVPPFYSFTIARPAEWLALFVFLITALITSQLATSARESIEQTRLRERESRILYEMGQIINSTDRLDEQLDTIVLSLVRVFSSWGVRACALLLPNQNGVLSIQADAPIAVDSFTLSRNEIAAAREVMAQGQIRDLSAAPSDATSQHALLRFIPLKTGNQTLGVLCLRIEDGVSWFASKQRMQQELERPKDQAAFFWAFLDEATLVIERARLRTRSISNNE